MDTKTKINTIISIVLVTLIAGLAYWAQIPSKDLKAELIDTDTVLVRIQDFAFDPDLVRIEPETTVSWLHDESEGNADVQHAVSSYDPEDTSAQGKEFESDLMTLGDTFSFTFNEPGVYYYNCSLHPFMTGKVCVGEESEALDEDCAIDAGTDTTTSDTTTSEEDTDTLGADEDNVLVDETDAVLNEDDTDLLPAADEDFDTSGLDDADNVDNVDNSSDSSTLVINANPVVTSTTNSTQTVQDTELSSSGPEDTIYLFVAIFALFMGRRLARNQA